MSSQQQQQWHGNADTDNLSKLKEQLQDSQDLLQDQEQRINALVIENVCYRKIINDLTSDNNDLKKQLAYYRKLFSQSEQPRLSSQSSQSSVKNQDDVFQARISKNMKSYINERAPSNCANQEQKSEPSSPNNFRQKMQAIIDEDSFSEHEDQNEQNLDFSQVNRSQASKIPAQIEHFSKENSKFQGMKQPKLSQYSNGSVQQKKKQTYSSSKNTIQEFEYNFSNFSKVGNGKTNQTLGPEDNFSILNDKFNPQHFVQGSGQKNNFSGSNDEITYWACQERFTQALRQQDNLSRSDDVITSQTCKNRFSQAIQKNPYNPLDTNESFASVGVSLKQQSQQSSKKHRVVTNNYSSNISYRNRAKFP